MDVRGAQVVPAETGDLIGAIDDQRRRDDRYPYRDDVERTRAPPCCSSFASRRRRRSQGEAEQDAHVDQVWYAHERVETRSERRDGEQPPPSAPSPTESPERAYEAEAQIETVLEMQ